MIGRFDWITLDGFVSSVRATFTLGAAAGTMIGLGVGSARSALFLVDQGLPVGDRDLVVIRMNFAKSQEAVAVAPVVDKGGLQ